MSFEDDAQQSTPARTGITHGRKPVLDQLQKLWNQHREHLPGTRETPEGTVDCRWKALSVRKVQPTILILNGHPNTCFEKADTCTIIYDAGSTTFNSDKATAQCFDLAAKKSLFWDDYRVIERMGTDPRGEPELTIFSSEASGAPLTDDQISRMKSQSASEIMPQLLEHM